MAGEYVIVITRKFASMGHAVAERLGEELGRPVYDRIAIEKLAGEVPEQETGTAPAPAGSAEAREEKREETREVKREEKREETREEKREETREVKREETREVKRGEVREAAREGWHLLRKKETRPAVPPEMQRRFDRQAQVIRELAEQGPCIFVGRCADRIVSGKRVLRVEIAAPEEVRLKNCMELLHADEESARSLIAREDRARELWRSLAGPEEDAGQGAPVRLDVSYFGAVRTADILADMVRRLETTESEEDAVSGE